MAEEKDLQLPREEQVQQFLMLRDLLASVYLEMKEFSKKKPDEPLNKFKVKNVNRILEPIKEILKYEPTLMFLDLLDDDVLPSNSDAILIIGQYTASMERFEGKHKYKDRKKGTIRWSTVEDPIDNSSWR